MANIEEGASFNEYLKRSVPNRIQAARLFSILLGIKFIFFFSLLLLIICTISVLCGERRLNAIQKEAYGQINIFINNTYDPLKQPASDLPTKSSFETMESDDSHF